MPTCFLIPCKPLRDGKTRLSACLDRSERHDLCRSLLHRTLRCATNVVPPEQIRVVTADPEAIAIASRHAVGAIMDLGLGLNAALEHARAFLRSDKRSVHDLIILPIDLPFVGPQCLADVLARTDDCIIAPDQAGTGTNLLALRSTAPRAVTFAFGPASCATHTALARSHALTIGFVRDWRLAFDLDEPAHYEFWLSHKAGAIA